MLSAAKSWASRLVRGRSEYSDGQSAGWARGGPYCKQIVEAIPMPAVDKATTVLDPRFIAKYGEKQGVIVLSKQVPFGLGIGVDALSNHLMGRTIVGTARKVFGPAPEFFEPRPDPLVVDAEWIEAAPEGLEIGGNPPR